MKVEAGPRNAPCTVYKYKPESQGWWINVNTVFKR